MKRFNISILFILGLLSLLGLGTPAAQQGKPPDVPVEELIRKIAANESRLRREFQNYLFKQDVTLQTITGKDIVTGELRRVSEIVMNSQGKREERIISFPPSPLMRLFTQADYQDLAGVQPFALASEDLPKYKVTYEGRQRVDELDTYVFGVQPAKPPDPKKINERYFQGRVWVDTEDLVVVKASGQGVPEDGKNQFPKFETWRENLDKGIWFPTYTFADDILEFDSGDMHIRMIVRLKDYRRFEGNLEVVPADEPEPPKSSPPSKPQPKP